jgi:hypothetical protein
VKRRDIRSDLGGIQVGDTFQVHQFDPGQQRLDSGLTGTPGF